MVRTTDAEGLVKADRNLFSLLSDDDAGEGEALKEAQALKKAQALKEAQELKKKEALKKVEDLKNAKAEKADTVNENANEKGEDDDAEDTNVNELQFPPKLIKSKAEAMSASNMIKSGIGGNKEGLGFWTFGSSGEKDHLEW